jgi:hypothetical protein
VELNLVQILLHTVGMNLNVVLSAEFARVAAGALCLISLSSSKTCLVLSLVQHWNALLRASKHFATKNWKEFEPPVLNKEEWKLLLFDCLVLTHYTLNDECL